jgi:hypothetical protein
MVYGWRAKRSGLITFGSLVNTETPLPRTCPTMHRQAGSLIHGQAADVLRVSSLDLPACAESVGSSGVYKRAAH